MKKKDRDNNNNDNKTLKNLIEFQDYYLIKENNIYKILIGKRKNDILFKCQKYELKLNNNDLSKLIKTIFNTIDESYKFIISIFESNKINISEIITNKSIKIRLKINICNKEKDIEIILLYNKENKDLVINELNNGYNELKNDINNLKDEIIVLRKEINNLKINNNNDNENQKKINLTPNIQYSKDLINDSFTQFTLDNTFSVFKSINNILYIIYTNKNKSIISYDLIDNKKVIEIKNAHEQYIINFRHYLDNIQKRDLVMSMSGEDNNIKVWNINNYELLLNIKNINNSGFLDSACFLNENMQTYIITSNVDYINSELIKVFDFEGNKIKEIDNSNDTTVFIDTYYEEESNKNYIITGNYSHAKSYDFNKNKIYQVYFDNNNKSHNSLIVNKTEEIVKLISSSEDGFIRVWNFHSGVFIDKIKISNNSIYGICKWDNEYIFIGCKDKTVKLLDLKTGKIIKILTGHNNYVLTIKKICIDKYGDCLITQGLKNESIKIWTNKIIS